MQSTGGLTDCGYAGSCRQGQAQRVRALLAITRDQRPGPAVQKRPGPLGEHAQIWGAGVQGVPGQQPTSLHGQKQNSLLPGPFRARGGQA